LRGFITIHPTKCDSDDQMEEDELSVSMWHVWGEKKCIKDFDREP